VKWVSLTLIYKLSHTSYIYRYVHSSMVPRNVETKLKVTTSPAGVLSGTSGRDDETHECISATLNEPSSCSLLSGLYSSTVTACCIGLLHYGLVCEMAQKQWLVDVRADFEQTIVNKAIHQWSKHAFVKAKGQHFEHSLLTISCIVWTDKMFKQL